MDITAASVRKASRKACDDITFKCFSATRPEWLLAPSANECQSREKDVALLKGSRTAAEIVIVLSVGYPDRAVTDRPRNVKAARGKKPIDRLARHRNCVTTKGLHKRNFTIGKLTVTNYGEQSFIWVASGCD